MVAQGDKLTLELWTVVGEDPPRHPPAPLIISNEVSSEVSSESMEYMGARIAYLEKTSTATRTAVCPSAEGSI